MARDFIFMYTALSVENQIAPSLRLTTICKRRIVRTYAKIFMQLMPKTTENFHLISYDSKPLLAIHYDSLLGALRLRTTGCEFLHFFGSLRLPTNSYGSLRLYMEGRALYLATQQKLLLMFNLSCYQDTKVNITT